MNSKNKSSTNSAICTHSLTKFYLEGRLARLTALDIIQFLAMPEEAPQMIIPQATGQNLRYILKLGIRLHHFGLNDDDTSLVEEL
ncbi:hypothetical protein L1887_04991 [Cichorium endivia]|nr:hypothetical protein L1887_04991 [Cichorium endivia]